MDDVTAGSGSTEPGSGALGGRTKELETIISIVPVGIAFVDADGTLTFANPAAHRMLGRPGGALEGVSYTDAFVGASAEAAGERVRVLEALRAGEHLWDAERSVERPDGTRVVLSMNAAPLRDRAGDVAGMVVSLADVTQQRRAEEEVRSSRRRLQALFDNALDAIFLGDDEGRVLDVNPAAERLLGHGRDAVIERSFLDFVNEDDVGLAQHLWSEFEATNAASGEVRLERRDGTVIDVEFRAVGGILPGLHLAVARDITHRKRTERALARSEARFRLLAENSDDVVYFLRLKPTPFFEYLNPATERVTGFPRDELYDDPALPLRQVHPEDRALLERSREDPTSFQDAIAFRWRRPDGSEVWLEESLAPVHDDEGVLVAVQGIVRDVTSHKRAQEAMRDALESERHAVQELQELNEMKNTFLRAVSHELRTPLTSVLGYAVTLEKRAADLTADQITDFMTRIARSARRLEQLLSDLLDIDRMSRGTVAADRVVTDVAALVRETVNEVDVGEREIVLDLEPTHVSLDGPKVARIVDNLVNNAGRHTPPGTTIWVRTRHYPQGLLLTVEDDGQGLPDGDRSLLFEPFGQGPAARGAASPGTGLGLSLVQRLTELHGGEVHAEDRPGGGARFRVLLPGEVHSDRTQPPPVSQTGSRRSRAVETPEHSDDELRQRRDAVSDASRHLLHVDTPEEATGVLVSLVHELGGWTVPMRMARASSLALDLAFGRGDPILPAADPGSSARKTMEDVLPELVDQARRRLRLGRASSSQHSDLGELEPGALTRLAAGLEPGDAVAIVGLDTTGELSPSESVALTERAATVLGSRLEDVVDDSQRVVRSARDAFTVTFPSTDPTAVAAEIDAVRDDFSHMIEDVTISAGVAAATTPGGTLALARAEDALSAARRTRTGTTNMASE